MNKILLLTHILPFPIFTTYFLKILVLIPTVVPPLKLDKYLPVCSLHLRGVTKLIEALITDVSIVTSNFFYLHIVSVRNLLFSLLVFILKMHQ